MSFRAVHQKMIVKRLQEASVPIMQNVKIISLEHYVD